MDEYIKGKWICHGKAYLKEEWGVEGRVYTLHVTTEDAYLTDEECKELINEIGKWVIGE